MSTAMVPNRVETPVAPILHRGESDHHAHTVQFYTDGAFLPDELSRFIGSALVAGQPRRPPGLGATAPARVTPHQ